MPFTRPNILQALLSWIDWALSVLDFRLTEWAGRLAVPVLLVALLSGEALPWLDETSFLISGPVIRGVHVVAGLLVMVMALGKVGGTLLRGLRHVIRFRSLHPGAALAVFRAQSPTRRLLSALYGIVLILVIVSGLARLALWGMDPLPQALISPPWMILHRVALPYLYTLLLFLFVIRGRIFYKRTLDYLHAP